MKQNKIVLCHVVTTLGVGGMENGIVNLANNHDRNKFEVVICCLNTAGAMAERLKGDVRLYTLCEGDGISLTRILRVARFLRKLKPDIVHTHAWGADHFMESCGLNWLTCRLLSMGSMVLFLPRKYKFYSKDFYLSSVIIIWLFQKH